ncbi:MAG: hypothetical protein KKF68_01670 [Nanoarchaeota archaeon]|nr:hypothetical protein [Nanoarchaeota archaeon]
MKKLVINLSNKTFYTLIAVGAILLLGIGVYAYGTTNPAVFGHSSGEVDLSGVDWSIILTNYYTKSEVNDRIDEAIQTYLATGGTCIDYAAGTSILVSDTTPKTYALSNSPVRLKEIIFSNPGGVRVEWTVTSPGSTVNFYTQIYKNGIAVSGTQHLISSFSAGTTYSHDVAVSAGDKIQLYGWDTRYIDYQLDNRKGVSSFYIKVAPGNYCLPNPYLSYSL